jgi:hypothetical protein
MKMMDTDKSVCGLASDFIWVHLRQLVLYWCSGFSVGLLGVLVLGTGCSSSNGRPSTQPATAIDYHEGQSNFWFAKPAVASVACSSYDALWNNASLVALADGFAIDREEYRNGLLTTKPLVSAQIFEPWKRDVGDLHEVVQSTISTVRRTIHFDLRRLPDGSFSASPKVLIEHHSLAERRITSVTEYLTVFQADRPLDEEYTEEGVLIVSDYWFAIGRDYALERKLAGQLQTKMSPGQCDQ